jgi:hypothetical protein
MQGMLEFVFNALAQQVYERSIQVCVDDGGMHITLSANALGIAEPLGHCFDGLNDVFLRLSVRIEFLKRFQSLGGTVPAQVRKSFAVKSWPVI